MVVQVLDDGVCALTYDSSDGDTIIRDHGFLLESRGVVCYVAPGVCRLLGFDDYMSLRHMCLLAQLLKSLRFNTAYRKAGVQHRPWGETVKSGFWQGEIHIDVKRLPEGK